MAIEAIRSAVLFTAIMVSLNGINMITGQLYTRVVGVTDIISLLENITDASTATSTFLPYLASLLRNQENAQNLTNILLKNTDTCMTDDHVVAILQDLLEDRQEHQDQVFRLLRDLQVNNNATTDFLMHNYNYTLTGMANDLGQIVDTLNQSADTQTNMKQTLNLMASTQDQIEDNLYQTQLAQIQSASTLNQSAHGQQRIVETLLQMANTLNQSADTQTNVNQTLNLMASTQNQIADDLHQTRLAQTPSASTLNQSAHGQQRMEETLLQMAKTLNQSMDTQHRMENSLGQIADGLTQVVHLLEVQSDQLRNTTTTMTHMIGQLQASNHIYSPTPKDCSDVFLREPFHDSGAYTISAWDFLGSFPVYCDADTGNNAWTVFQRRFDGSVDFYLGWDAYEAGFGNPEGEFWLGLRQIHRLTKQGVWILRIDVEDFEGRTAYAEYESFSVGDTASNYRLSIGAYSGTAGDSLPAARHNNQAFSTRDRDHDSCNTCYGHGNCAQDRQGAWWYANCADSNLNGPYLGESQSSLTGMIWYHWKHNHEVLKRSEMKIRRIR